MSGRRREVPTSAGRRGARPVRSAVCDVPVTFVSSDAWTRGGAPRGLARPCYRSTEPCGTGTSAAGAIVFGVAVPLLRRHPPHGRPRQRARRRPCAHPGSRRSSGFVGGIPLAFPCVIAMVVAATLALSAQVSASVHGYVLFNGTTKAAWALNQSAAADRITQLDGFDGLAGPVLRFTALDGDIAPATPTNNPRAQLVSPLLFYPGQVVWESWMMFFPASVPYVSSTQWLALWTPAYGAPFAGSPPTEFVVSGSRLELGRNAHAAVPWQPAWSMPVPRGRWTRFTVHFKFAANGWLALYVDGRAQSLREGLGPTARRLAIALIDASNDAGPNASRIFVYYQQGAFPQVTVYYADFRIALTRAAAEAR